jgi:hypothetical protein
LYWPITLDLPSGGLFFSQCDGGVGDGGVDLSGAQGGEHFRLVGDTSAHP